MRRSTRAAKSPIARKRGYRSLSGPEHVEPRRLMDGALPQLVADTFMVHTNDDPQLLDVLANDNFSGYSGPERITALSFPTAGGTADISSDGKEVLFRPSADFSGTDTFSYVVDDQFTAQVTVQVVSPLANDSAIVFPDGQPHVIDVLANDPFWENYTGVQQITSLSATQLGGTASIAADGRSVIYSAPGNLADLGGTDSFSYIVDGKYTADVTVSLFNPLAPANKELPQNSNPTLFTPIAESNFAAWPGYAGPELVTKVSDSTPGSSVSIGADGRSISYQPAKDYLGPDTISYVVDGKFSSTITVDVGAVVQPDSFEVDENDPGTVLSVLQNDVYYSSAGTNSRIATQVTLVTQPDQGGHVAIASNGMGVLYTPSAGFVGSETFTYQANGKYTTTVTVNVSRPVRDDYYPSLGQRIVADSKGNVLDVLANDFHQPGIHTITAVDTPSEGGLVTIQPDGQKLLYTPKPGFYGQEQFNYTVDGQYTATVFLQVESPATDLFQQLDPTQGQSSRVDVAPNLRGLGGYTGNGLVTAVSVISGNVTVEISADGQAVLITSHDFSPATISYTIDGKYTANLSVLFRSSLYLGPSKTVVDENLSSTIDVLANAPWQYDSWGQGFVVYQGSRLITDAFGAQHGTVTVSADGKTVLYRPATDYVGQDSFQYLVDGHELGSATVQVIRRVRDDQFHVEPDSQGNVLPVESNDQLGGGYTGLGQITAVGAADHGKVRISADGHSLVYTPAPGYAGADTVTYTVDGHLDATVQISVASDAESQYPRFGSLQALEDWLLQNALRQYGSLFGTVSLPIYYPFDAPNHLDVAGSITSSSNVPHSQTNVQVAGVGEADITEADSNYLYVLSGGKLVISQALSSSPLAIDSQTPIDGSPIGMYLSGDRLTVISQSGGLLAYPQTSPLWLPPVWGYGQTSVTVFDVTDRCHPRVVQKTVFDGTNIDSRMIGNLVYLVLNNSNSLSLPAPLIVGGVSDNVAGPIGTSGGRYETKDEYVSRLRANFGALLDSILPHFRSYGPDGSLIRSGLLLSPEEIGMPPDPADQSLVSVVTIDTAGREPGIVAATGIFSTPDAKLYMNHDSMYLLRQVYGDGDGQTTDIWKFTLDETTGYIAPAAQGQVPGVILDQFSVDESNGDLRVATTISNVAGDNWSGVSENDVWVLRQSGNLLELAGSLQNLAHGESIRSVQYSGNRVVITTFPTVELGFDPVYCIDLTDTTQPRFVGELTLPGFNQYMQFIDATHVLTVGVNAPTVSSTAIAGVGMPLQVSLFDVSDFAHPHLMDQYTLARYSTSLAQQDHHAFGWFADLGILALPVAHNYTKFVHLNGAGQPGTTTIVNADEVEYFRIQTTLAPDSGAAVQLLGTIDLAAAALRSEFIGHTLYAIGDGQIVASSIDDPGTPLGSVCWPVPPVIFYPIFPINFPPIQLPLGLVPSSVISLDPAPAEVSPVLQAAPTEQQQLAAWVEAARKDLGSRLNVPAESALLVSVEAPTPGSSDSSPSANDASGLKFVLRSGQQNLLYQVTNDGSVQLVDADFHFPSAVIIASNSAPTADVNQDGQVTALDALEVINDLLAHAGPHRDEDAVLRQLTGGTSFAALDVNHDGFVTALDALLVINALESQTVTATKVNSAGSLPLLGPVPVSPGIASPAALDQMSAISDSALPSVLSISPSTATTPTAAAPAASPLQFGNASTAARLRQSRHDAALATVDDWAMTVLHEEVAV